MVINKYIYIRTHIKFLKQGRLFWGRQRYILLGDVEASGSGSGLWASESDIKEEYGTV